MDYKHINSFFGNLSKIINKNDILNDSIIYTINQKTKVLLNNKDFVVRNNNIYIKTSPIVRNEILINKENILLSLKEKNISILDMY